MPFIPLEGGDEGAGGTSSPFVHTKEGGGGPTPHASETETWGPALIDSIFLSLPDLNALN